MPTLNWERVLLGFASIILAAGLSSTAMAQADADAGNARVHHRNNCRLAHQVLVSGQPASKYEWALGYSTGCGALGGEGLATVLPRYRAVAGPGGQLEKVVEAAALLTDGRVFDAALTLAEDREAGVGARVQAIRIVYHQLNTATFQVYEAFVNDPWKTKTGYIPLVGSEASSIGAPLPKGAMDRAETLLSGIVSDSAAPEPVRLAATYLRDEIRLKQARARLCGAGVVPAECTRLLDEWEAQQEPVI